LGIGDWAQSPIPNPQSPIPNPQSPIKFKVLNLKINIYKNDNFKLIIIIYQIKNKYYPNQLTKSILPLNKIY
jgi:hypothetical protein